MMIRRPDVTDVIAPSDAALRRVGLTRLARREGGGLDGAIAVAKSRDNPSG
jgi:hypothetical protein